MAGVCGHVCTTHTLAGVMQAYTFFFLNFFFFEGEDRERILNCTVCCLDWLSFAGNWQESSSPGRFALILQKKNRHCLNEKKDVDLKTD